MLPVRIELRPSPHQGHATYICQRFSGVFQRHRDSIYGHVPGWLREQNGVLPTATNGLTLEFLFEREIAFVTPAAHLSSVNADFLEFTISPVNPSRLHSILATIARLCCGCRREPRIAWLSHQWAVSALCGFLRGPVLLAFLAAFAASSVH